MKSIPGGLAWVLVALAAFPARAQWALQTLDLRPGWNAVYLEVQPEPSECDRVFAGLPVESVWRSNRRFAPVQYIQDPATLIPPQPDWLVYFPNGHPMRGHVNLFALEGGQAYLVKLREDTGPISWALRGRVIRPRLDWVSQSLNLVGVTLPAGTGATFADFFRGSPSHAAGPFYRLGTDGHWTAVAGSTTMQHGEAFWIWTGAHTTYPGPVGVQLEQGTGLDFGSTLEEQTLTLHNLGTAPATLSIRLLESQAPASPDWPALAGPVPLAYWAKGPTAADAEWVNLPSVLSSGSLAPGDPWKVRLAVRRAAMVPSPGASAGTRSAYQSVLEVYDSGGLCRCWVPVTAYGPTGGPVSGLRRHGPGSTASPGPGLWVGHAAINQVSQPAGPNPFEPVAAPSSFQFRLILHCDRDGQLRLLQKVVQLWKEGTYKPDPEDPGQRMVDRGGQYVLLTEDGLLSRYVGSTLRDGVPAGRRFSTSAFAFREPVLFASQGPDIWQAELRMGYDDPLNPFKHLHHPDHDNLNRTYDAWSPEGRESFTVVRALRLEFTSQDPERRSVPGWGYRQVGGIYQETLHGLHRVPIVIRGAFRLHRASEIATLNDQE